jgi:hypothetical protein
MEEAVPEQVRTGVLAVAIRRSDAAPRHGAATSTSLEVEALSARALTAE